MPILPRRTQKVAWCATSALFVFALASCTSETEPSFTDAIMNSPYRSYFEDALTSEQTPQFQKDILIDGVITDAELDEARNRFKTCFEDQGYDVALIPGSYNIGDGGTGDPPALVEAAFDDCQSKFVMAVEPLHNAMLTNPDNVEWRLNIVSCLKRHNLVDATFTVEQVDESFDSGEGIVWSDTHDCLRNPQN